MSSLRIGVVRIENGHTASTVGATASGIRHKGGDHPFSVAHDSSLADDFVIAGKGPLLHVLNAPSPAATASLAIGEHLTQ